MTQVYDALAQQGGHAAGHFPDWGNIPAYFGGLALLIAIITLSRDHRDRRRSQAQKVAAWVEEDEDGCKIVLRNKSELPVTKVLIGFNEGFKNPDAVRLGKPSRADRRRKPKHIDVLPPDATVTIGPFKPGPVWVTSLEFIDSSGSWWIRTHTQLRPFGGSRIVFWTKKRWLRIKRQVLWRQRYRVDQD
jgi:hypothetical protein